MGNIRERYRGEKIMIKLPKRYTIEDLRKVFWKGYQLGKEDGWTTNAQQILADLEKEIEK